MFPSALYSSRDRDNRRRVIVSSTILGQLGRVEIPSIFEKGRKGEKRRKSERGGRERRGAVGGPIVEPESAFSLALRAVIDCLTVHADDEKTSRNSLPRRRGNGAIENTFRGTSPAILASRRIY